MKTTLSLTDFLDLSIESATDIYLRELAMIAIQSRQLAHTVEQLRGYKHSAYPCSVMEAEEPKNELIESRYFIAEDGTVTDQETKLMWMQSPLEDTFTFQEAQQAAQNLNARKGFSGHTDWRVPSQEELLSLVVETNSPSICQEAFPDTPAGWFWTSTLHAENSADAWMVYFSNGCTFDLKCSYHGFVRLVR